MTKTGVDQSELQNIGLEILYLTIRSKERKRKKMISDKNGYILPIKV